jgi:hypothetical protein
MSAPTIVNSIGLVFNVVGAILIWRYGLPEPLSPTGARYLRTGMIDENDRATAARFTFRAKLGLGLLIAGFLAQLASNFLR